MDVNIDDNPEKIQEARKIILDQFQMEIEKLNRLAIELKNSSEFVIQRYEDLNLGVINPTLPEIKTGIPGFDDAGNVTEEPEDRSADQLAAFEASKKPFNPMDVAKYYKDMIFNILN
jgi:hypothetical protein